MLDFIYKENICFYNTLDLQYVSNVCVRKFGVVRDMDVCHNLFHIYRDRFITKGCIGCKSVRAGNEFTANDVD